MRAYGQGKHLVRLRVRGKGRVRVRVRVWGKA